MLRMKPYTPSTRVAVSESLDEDLSDDIEDDVFIRDGKSIKCNEEKGLKRPLMAPRRRNGKSSGKSLKSNRTVAALFRQKGRCWRCCEPFCYACAAIFVLIALMFLAAFLLTLFPVSLQKIRTVFRNADFRGEFSQGFGFIEDVNPCTQISVNKVWSKAYSKLSTESPVRKVDVNGDGIEDILIGFAVDTVDTEDTSRQNHADPDIPKCETENGGYRKIVFCEGGILAVDGATGNTIWQRWTSFIIFSLYCKSDLNLDGQTDCVAAGRGGLIAAINGKNGEILWNFKEREILPDRTDSIVLTTDLYTINGVRDLDGDTVSDIVASHVMERQSQDGNVHTSGHIVLISGQSGREIRSMPTPHEEEVYTPPQLITRYDGTEVILVASGGQNTAGGIYLISLQTMMAYSKDHDFTTVFRSPSSGFMVPIIMADVNSDGIEDIVASLFNSTVYAFDGRSLNLLWQYSFADSESVSAIVPGHYNRDNVTDFMVKYNTGPGFPVYYYSQTQILNGASGKPLLDQTINDSGGPNGFLAGVSISQTFGGDFFLHWQTQCRGKYDVKEAYRFFPGMLMKGSDILHQSRADTCMLRYNSSTVLKLYAITRHIQEPGAVIFSSDDLLLQLNQTNLEQLEKQYAVSPLKHPKLSRKLFNKEQSQNKNATVAANANSSNIKLMENKVPDQQNNLYQNDKIKTNGVIPSITLNNMKMVKDRKKILNMNNNENMLENNANIPIDMNPEKLIYNPIIMGKQPINDLEELNEEMVNERQKVLKDLILANRDRFGAAYGNEREQDPEQPTNIEEYDADDPNYRAQYPNNRDIRSKQEIDYVNDLEQKQQNVSNNSSELHPVPKEMPYDILKNTNTGKSERRETLWDLEMEKENEEAVKEAQMSSSSEIRRREIDLPFNNQNLLSSIASSGVLTKPMDNTASTLDLVFVLNVRESELYPPLFLPEDFKCVQEKLRNLPNGYVNGFTKDLDEIEKQFMKQCLEQRLPNIQPHKTKFESQIVVTRLSITCSCAGIKEKCSAFNSIDKQKWTEFMGNSNTGFY